MDDMGVPPEAGQAPLRPIGALTIPGAQAAAPAACLSFASMFRPARAVDMSKVRVGSASDGGYVMLDDFREPSIALSFGVGDDTSWDRHMANLGAIVHQYDHTVEAPADQPASIRFYQKRIVDVADGVGVTLQEASAALEAEGGARPAILKIDIEGSEWLVLDAAPDSVLERFDQIVCEFHDLECMADATWLERASRVAAKLNRIFEVVHVHGNNHRPVMVIDGAVFPWVLEVTYARRARHRFEPTDEQFPTDLDRSNHPQRPDYWLGSFAFGLGRPAPDGGDAAATEIHAEAAEDLEYLRDALVSEIAWRDDLIAALAAERGQTEDAMRPLRGYEEELRRVHLQAKTMHEEAVQNLADAARSEEALRDELRRVHLQAKAMHEEAVQNLADAARSEEALRDELRRVHLQAKTMHEEAVQNLADAARSEEALRDELRRSTAARANLDEDARRSQSSAREAHERFGALAVDFENSLRTIAAGRAELAEAADRHRTTSSLLDAARAEAERFSFEIVIAERAKQALDAELAQQVQIQAAIQAEVQQHREALADSLAEAGHTKARAMVVEARAKAAEAGMSKAEVRAGVAEAGCRAVMNSTSWRITMPVRAVVRRIRGR